MSLAFSPAPPLILFGAFDRHNFGDLLLAHVATALAGNRPVLHAGLAERDLRPWGGHRVQALAELAAQWETRWGDAPADLCHVGGELLTCSLYQAAVMLLGPEAAIHAIARHEADPDGGQAWAEAQLGVHQGIAYLAPKALFRHPGRFSHLAIGGVDLPALAPAMRAEAAERLRASDALVVRDRLTQAHLAGLGIPAPLAPDPGVLAAELFAGEIAAHATTGEPAQVAASFPDGYLAFQCSAEFGDEGNLAPLADQLDRIARDTGLGLVLFRAGLAPWHDDLALYQRLRELLHPRTPAQVFTSPQLWDICALLAGARAYCGSSLHGRIVAQACGVPGVSLLHPEIARGSADKQRAYWDTWPSWDARHDGNPGTAGLATPEHLHHAVLAALAADRDSLRQLAARQAALARRALPRP